MITDLTMVQEIEVTIAGYHEPERIVISDFATLAESMGAEVQDIDYDCALIKLRMRFNDPVEKREIEFLTEAFEQVTQASDLNDDKYAYEAEDGDLMSDPVMLNFDWTITK